MKTCKFFKHSYNYYGPGKTPPCVYCYLKHVRYPEKKDPDDTCPAWEPDEEDEDDFETYEEGCYDN